LLRVHLPFADSASETLSARVIAGGEGGDPRLRGEGEVGCGIYKRWHLGSYEAPPHPPIASQWAPPSPPLRGGEGL